jgi:putative spermidine/putrescine transport system ATP-binding protein
MLELEGVSRHFGDFVAVAETDLRIDHGEFLTLLGPSGSGKSTTLYMIAGFDSPTSGDVRIDGQSVLGLTPNRRNVGMVFQRYSLFPHMTVRENVGFPLSVRKYPKGDIQDRVDRTLKLVQLDDFAHRKPSELSGGQQQRVALARALSYEPRLLLMDEPLSALDRKLREDLQQEIRSLHDRIDTTIIYVTHDQEEALRLSDRIAVFNHGHIVQIGSGEDLYHRPQDSFVASFIGASTFMVAPVRALEGETAVLEVAGAENGIHVPRLEGVQTGDEVLMMIRPERVRLCAQAPTDGTNAMPGRVREAVFLGDNVTYVVETHSGIEVRVKSVHHIDSGHRFREGAECWIAWDVQDTHVFRDWDPEDIERQLA